MKKIVIFGTGNAGRAIYRTFKDNKEYKIVAFIDNNKDMVGKDYKGISIFSPNEYDKLEFDYIVYGGVWHKQMKTQLKNLGILDEKIKLISEDELIYTSDEREKSVDNIVKKLDEYLQSKNIEYYLEGSSGLYLLRGKSLSYGSDVDIFVLKYDELLILAQELPKIFSDLNIEIVKFQKDDLVRKKNQIDRICITDNSEEKVIIDIGMPDKYGEYLVTNYNNNKFFYIPKWVYEGGFVRMPYKNFYVSMLAKYDDFFTITYGKNYIEVPKSWSESDYGNLVSIDKLKQMCKKK